ncbi:MAG: hypothetical protein FJY65_08870 [Calditrichaeota bacterium]|nr:hypothetical protein [Calditrichota bacterium]
MGRISAHIRIDNPREPTKVIECDTLVDTGSAYLILPTDWKDRLGELKVYGEVECETATQQRIKAKVYGPIELQIEGFRTINAEVLFLDIHPVDGHYEPLLGYIPLEQSNAVVDVLGHRLVHIDKVDLK